MRNEQTTYITGDEDGSKEYTEEKQQKIVGCGTCVDSPLLEVRKKQHRTNQTKKKKKTLELTSVSRKDYGDTRAQKHIYVFTFLRQGHVEENERERKRETLGNTQRLQNV